MRQLLAAGLVVLAAGSATAADFSALRPVPPASYNYNWTGCYIGIHGGGVAYRNSLVGTWSDGGLFGGQIGCNYQIDHLVMGLEAEGSWSGADSTLTTATFPLGGLLTPTVTTFKNTWDATFSGRIGLAYDRFFFYQKIGIIWGDNQFTSVVPVFGGVAPLAGSATSTGLLAGVGVEYGLMPRWTVKAEIDYAFMGDTQMTNTCAATPANCAGLPAITSFNSFVYFAKLGANYRF